MDGNIVMHSLFLTSMHVLKNEWNTLSNFLMDIKRKTDRGALLAVICINNTRCSVHHFGWTLHYYTVLHVYQEKIIIENVQKLHGYEKAI